MSKYIDKDELWERLRKSIVYHICTNTLFNTIKAVIDGMPTIEVSDEELRKKYKDFYEQGKFDALVEVSEDCIYTYCSRCGMRVVVDAPSVTTQIETQNSNLTFEKVEDCISREWVLEEFEKGRETISKSEYFDELIWLVIHAPSVVPTQSNAIQCVESVGNIGKERGMTELITFKLWEVILLVFVSVILGIFGGFYISNK